VRLRINKTTGSRIAVSPYRQLCGSGGRRRIWIMAITAPAAADNHATTSIMPW
jgi:hypothetical protein